MDAQCDKLAKVVGRTSIVASIVNLIRPTTVRSRALCICVQIAAVCLGTAGLAVVTSLAGTTTRPLGAATSSSTADAKETETDSTANSSAARRAVPSRTKARSVALHSVSGALISGQLEAERVGTPFSLLLPAVGLMHANRSLR